MILRGVCAWTWGCAQQSLLQLTSILAPAPNGVRYPRVGGTRQRRFDGTSFKPRKLPENAATPTRRVHAVLGGNAEAMKIEKPLLLLQDRRLAAFLR